jgi:hypothetical protein
VAARFRSPADLWLAVRIMAWACALPLLKRIMPIRSLARLVWRRPRLAHDEARDELVVLIARWACRVTRPGSGGNCLERGLIAYRFLLEGRAAPTLVVGMRRAEPSQLMGHAWVLLHGVPAGESLASVGEYVPVFAFGPDGSLIRSFEPSKTPELSPTTR